MFTVKDFRSETCFEELKVWISYCLDLKVAACEEGNQSNAMYNCRYFAVMWNSVSASQNDVHNF